MLAANAGGDAAGIMSHDNLMAAAGLLESDDNLLAGLGSARGPVGSLTSVENFDLKATVSPPPRAASSMRLVGNQKGDDGVVHKIRRIGDELVDVTEVRGYDSASSDESEPAPRRKIWSSRPSVSTRGPARGRTGSDTGSDNLSPGPDGDAVPSNLNQVPPSPGELLCACCRTCRQRRQQKKVVAVADDGSTGVGALSASAQGSSFVVGDHGAEVAVDSSVSLGGSKVKLDKRTPLNTKSSSRTPKAVERDRQLARAQSRQRTLFDMHKDSPWFQKPGADWKHTVHMFVNEPMSSPGAFYFAMCILLLILTSTMALLLETMKGVRDATDPMVWPAIEIACMSVFVPEIMARMWVAKSWKNYFSDFLNDVDLLIVIFFFVGIGLEAQGVESVRVIRSLRLVRVTRMFQLSHFASTITLLIGVLQRSIQSLLLLLFLVNITVVVFASAIFFIEDTETADADYQAKGFPNNPFTSIPATMYWCMVTVTSIGYGDIYPATDVGRFTAVFAVVTGSVMMAMPLSVITTHFLQATREAEMEWREKIAKSRSAVAVKRLKSVASMRAPDVSASLMPRNVTRSLGVLEESEDESAPHSTRSPAAGDAGDGTSGVPEADIIEAVRIIDEAEKRWDEQIDKMVAKLIQLHNSMVDEGIMTERLPWR